MGLERHLLARHQVVLVPPLPLDRVRARQLEIVGRHLPGGIGDVDVQVHVWIGPLDLRDDTRGGDRFVVVVFGLEPVMREHGRREAEQSDACHQDPFHRPPPMPIGLASLLFRYPPAIPI